MKAEKCGFLEWTIKMYNDFTSTIIELRAIARQDRMLAFFYLR